MTTFHITAVNKEGNTYEETIEAADRFAVYRDIRERGDQLLNIEKKGNGVGFSLETLNHVFASVSDDEKVIFTRNVAAMLDAGLPMSRVLSVIEKQTKNKKLKSIVTSLMSEINQGHALSTALSGFKDVFSSLVISMVKAGEESGKLSHALREVSMQMSRTNRLKKKIRGALMYPSIVLIAMIGIGILMLIYVVPTLTETFKDLGSELPGTTQAVIAVSDFLSSSPLLSLGLFIGAILVFAYTLKTPVGTRAFDWIMLNAPAVRGLVMETNSARTARTLASLLSSGVDMVRSISITREVIQNSFYQKVLFEAEEKVIKGEPISGPFHENPHLYPPLVAEMVAVGEETGRLSELLQETAEFYEESVEQKTKDLSTIIEPFLMLIIGIGVGFFALSMIAPIYGLSGAI